MSKWKAKIFDISSIGIADVLSSGIASIFWLYIATTIGPEKYGEITYLLSIATLASGLSLLGSNYTLMIYSAKKNSNSINIISFNINCRICSCINSIFLFCRYRIKFNNFRIYYFSISYI